MENIDILTQLNPKQFSFHSYHYSILLIQLALDSKSEELLFASAEDSYYDILRNLECVNDTFLDRLNLYMAFLKMSGLAEIEPIFITKDIIEVKVIRSHFDEGWLRKFGKSNKPINIILNGFLCAMFSTIFGESKRMYYVQELGSIAEGERYSTIKIIRK